MSKPIGEAGLHLIQYWEGCKLKAYKAVPTEKYWTIGWGHYGPDVREGDTITQQQADAMLVADLQRYADAVDNPGNCPQTAQLNANQRDALISFTYNCGAGCLRTLCKGRTLPQIAAAMPQYNKAGGKVLVGLQRRRAAEVALFNKPIEEDDFVDWSKVKPSDINRMSDDAVDALVTRIQSRQAEKQVSPKLQQELDEAVAAGITDGSSPMAFCTRAQAAVMVKRASK